MTVPAEPLFFDPIYKETIWGGTALADRLGRRVPQGAPIGESWEIASHGADQSTVCRGPLKGTTLKTLMNREGTALAGSAGNFGSFPLLCKFIDTRDRLSVQVHPDDRLARTYGFGEFGKTECWYIIGAAPDARVITGFNRSVTREDILHAIESATLDRILSYTPVSPGDLVFIPGGTVHAILENIFLYEVQETSDTTLRLYDWGRVDRSGCPRALHVHDALKVIDLQAHGPFKVPRLTIEDAGHRHSILVACRHFAIEHYRFLRSGEIILPAKQSFRIVTVINGSLSLRYPGGRVELPPGCTTLLPALLRDVRAQADAATELLVSSIPDLQREIVVPLRERGIADQAIASVGGFPGYNDLAALLRP